jgi:hypothetical protein
MAIPRWLVAPPEEAMGARGMTTASASTATRPRVAIMNKKYNTRNQHGERHQGQDPLEPSHHDTPTIDLRQKINKERDARLVIEARGRDRTSRRHDDDDSDRFPAFTTSITDKSYPKNFKPVRIPRSDGNIM